MPAQRHCCYAQILLVYQKVAVLLRIDCTYCRQIGIDDYCLYEFHAALFRIF